MNEMQSHIIETSIHLIAAEGLGVSTARIAREAGISNGSLFNAFPTKIDLISQVYLAIRRQMADAIMDRQAFEDGADLQQATRAMWDAAVDWILANRDAFHTLNLLKSARTLPQDVTGDVQHLFSPAFAAFQRAMDAGQMQNIPLPLVGEMANAQLYAISEYLELNNIPPSDVPKASEACFNAFWRGLRP
ncbi:MAG: hypothetical protein Alpg2KO_10930 [Alphaproteobacteria bacterium]